MIDGQLENQLEAGTIFGGAIGDLDGDGRDDLVLGRGDAITVHLATGPASAVCALGSL